MNFITRVCIFAIVECNICLYRHKDNDLTYKCVVVCTQVELLMCEHSHSIIPTATYKFQD